MLIGGYVMSTATFMLKGDALLKHQDEYAVLIQRGEKTRTDAVLDAGYAYDNGKPMYTQYYTELLNARGVTPATMTDVNDQAYEDLDSDAKALYDAVDKQFGKKWDHDDVMEFLEELNDIGIYTASDLEEAFYGVYDSEKEFAEEFCNEVESINSDSSYYFAIDWQRVWDHNLRYDFDSIEFDYSVFFFRNC
jgi:hypothetical protein